MNQLQRHDFPVTLKAHNPAPKTELDFTTPFELLIAVMLSAQATEVSINKATKKLYPTVNTAETLFALGVEELKPYNKTIGLFNYKAENVIKTCRLIIDTHSSEVPESREALEALPGVGRKTANVVLNIAFNHPVIAVDTHLFRLSNRAGLAKGKAVRAFEDKLMKVTPKEFMQDAHHWLIIHSCYVCIARKPRCVQRVVSHPCDDFRRRQ